MRAIAAKAAAAPSQPTFPVDLTADGAALSDDDHLDLHCGPEEAAGRLEKLAEIGFDDAVVTVSTFTEEHMAAVRALHP